MTFHVLETTAKFVEERGHCLSTTFSMPQVQTAVSLRSNFYSLMLFFTVEEAVLHFGGLDSSGQSVEDHILYVGKGRVCRDLGLPSVPSTSSEGCMKSVEDVIYHCSGLSPTGIPNIIHLEIRRNKS